MLSAMGKELKLARARIKEAEDEAKVSYIIDCLVAYSWLMSEVEYTEKDRAAAAEYALEVMTGNFEALSAENHRLRDSLEELRDSKVGVKQVRWLLILM